MNITHLNEKVFLIEFWNFLREISGNFFFIKCWEPCQRVRRTSDITRLQQPLPQALGRSSWSGGWHVQLLTNGSAVRICLVPEHFDLSRPWPVVHDWVNKGLGMSSRVCATGHIKDLVPLIEESRASCPSGRFPPSLLHQVIIITRLNKLYICMFFPPEDGLRCQQGVKPPLKLKNSEVSCMPVLPKKVVDEPNDELTPDRCDLWSCGGVR